VAGYLLKSFLEGGLDSLYLDVDLHQPSMLRVLSGRGQAVSFLSVR
jgi:hypothetical protein